MKSFSVKVPPELARAIIARRNELHLSQGAAAKLAGVSQTTWCGYEHGCSIHKSRIKDLCRALQWPGLPSKKSLAALKEEPKETPQEAQNVQETQKTDAPHEPMPENDAGDLQMELPLENNDPLPPLEEECDDGEREDDFDDDDDDDDDLDDDDDDEDDEDMSWLDRIRLEYSDAAAQTFQRGVALLNQYIKEDMALLSKMPKGTHIGQIQEDSRFLAYFFPKQFLTDCTYEVLYAMQCALERFDALAVRLPQIYAHTVLEEVVLYLAMKAGSQPLKKVRNADAWLDEEWLYDTFGDEDVVTCLFSGSYINEDNVYHFSHWTEEVFWMGRDDTLSKNDSEELLDEEEQDAEDAADPVEAPVEDDDCDESVGTASLPRENGGCSDASEAETNGPVVRLLRSLADLIAAK